MTRSKLNQPTIFDIASAAGVSTATVSRVYNRPDSVRDATRHHVLAIAKKYGFTLSERRPGPKPQQAIDQSVISFVYILDPDLPRSAENSEIFLQLKSGIQKAANSANIRLDYKAIDSRDDEFFDDQNCVGYVLLGAQPAPKLTKQLRKKPCCWIMAGEWLPDWGDHIMPDHREVGRLAARYLIDQSHKRIAMVSGRAGERIHRFREEGFAYELNNKKQISWQVIGGEDLSMMLGPYSSDALMYDQIAEALVSISPRPDACFIDSDQTLAEIYPRLLEHNYLPGRDFRVVSCNASPIIQKKLPFPFRSIDVQFELIGQIGLGQVIWRINNPDINRRIRTLILPELI